jgi:phosphopantothenoylcysteine decarboxylase/phosphopantothenoylcysteine decarboxylase/phosphopantothenate--cysteine ligase
MSSLAPTSKIAGKTIVLGVTGSIAAYKSAEIVSQLLKAGHEVFVVMTRRATEFVTPLTLATLSRNPVLCDLSEENSTTWKPGHIELADRADLLMIAPASANTIARLAHGFADDALGAVALATRAALLIAPAMNGKMWDHPATQENVETLRRRGASLVGPAEGILACGYEGPGRLAEVTEILKSAENILSAGRSSESFPR